MTKMDRETLKQDIPLSAGLAAHAGTSYVPEKRAEQERDGYADQLLSDWDALQNYATTEEKRAQLGEEFARYREGYKARYLAYLGSRSRVVSVMIAGPSKFPVRQMEKRNNSADNRLSELLEFRERALKAIKRDLTPEAQPIRAGDADAVSRYGEKVDKAEKMQAVMIAANKIVRATPKNQSTPEKVAQLVVLGVSEENAAKLFEPDYCGRYGFPDYAIRNNGANIRRMKQAADRIEQTQTIPTTEQEGATARLEDCPAENRVRLFFPGKPAEEVRAKLKSRGFRWTPSMGCWQAYRNAWAVDAAKEFAGIAKP